MPRASKTQPDAPARPRLVRKTTPKAPAPPPPGVSHEQIALRAYALFEQQGFQHGYHLDHWFRAEQELTDVLLTPRPAKKVADTSARS